MGEEVRSLLWAIFVTGLVLVLAYWFTRYVAGRMSAGGPVRGRRISVLEQVTVGKDQKLMLVKLGGQLYFLAVTSGGATVLRELSQEEAEQLLPQEGEGAGAADSFAKALRQVLEQRKK